MFVANEVGGGGIAGGGGAAEGKKTADGDAAAALAAKKKKKAEEVPWARVRALVREYVALGSGSGWADECLRGARPREIAAFVHDVAVPGYALGPGAGPDPDPIIFSSSDDD